MEILIVLTASLYFVVALSGFLKGQGFRSLPDEWRQRLVNGAFIWHSLLILWPLLQYGGYPYITFPYERVMVAWAIIIFYLFWTRKFNYLILEIYILLLSSLLLFSFILLDKMTPHIISWLWLSGGGIFKHLFLVLALAFFLNLIAADLLLPADEKDKQRFSFNYLLGLAFWVLALAFYYYWLNQLNSQALVLANPVSPFWIIAATLFILATLYLRRLKDWPEETLAKAGKLVNTFLALCLFAVAFAL